MKKKLLDTIYIIFCFKFTDDLNWWVVVTLAEKNYRTEKHEYTCKRDDRLPHQKSRVFIASKSRFVFVHFTLKENLKMFITEYIPVVRFIVS